MPPAKRSLTDGPLLSSLLTLALPIVFANILQSAYQLTDTFWVGRLGGNAVASVSVSFPLIFLMISMGGGFTIAGSTLVAQYTGAKNSRMVNLVAGQTLLLVVVASALLSTLGYFTSGSLLEIMGVEDLILQDATQYLRVSFVGLVFMFGYFMYQSIMRGLGEVRVPLYIVLGTVVLNLVLDPLFIFGYGPVPPMGVAGAAYATIGTQSVAMIIGFIVLFSGRYGIRLTRTNLTPDWKMLSRIINLGLPASIDQSTRALAMSVMTFLVTSFGTLTVAVFGIGSRILGFVIIPALGLSMATSTLVGQNIGAGKIERAKAITKIAALVAFVSLSGVGIVCFFAAETLVSFFVPGDAQVIEGGATFVRIIAPAFALIGVQQSLVGAFRGSGSTFLSMMLSIVTMWMFQFPVAYILSKHTSLESVGLWCAYPISNFFACLVATGCFFHGGWLKKQLTAQGAEAESEVSEAIIGQEGLR